MEGEYGEEGREEKGGGGRGGAGRGAIRMKRDNYTMTDRRLHCVICHLAVSPSLCDLSPGGVTFTV